MTEIYKNLFIGNDKDCMAHDFATVHACKTCHKKSLGYTNALPQTHPKYLVNENGTHIYLNMVDMLKEFSAEFTNPMFKHAIDFIHHHIKDRKILIHCNQGVSRAPSVGLVYLASIGELPNQSFDAAAMPFMKLYSDYIPGNGILLYLRRNWDYLMRMTS